MNRRSAKGMLLLLLWGGVGVAGAAETEAPSAVDAAARPAQSGAATRQWLERQREGRQASAKAQPLSGPVQEQIHERYRKSFSREIPEDFKREGIGGSSNAPR